MTSRPHRDTIWVESAELTEVRAYPAGQFVHRIQAPETAAHAKAGTFIHVTCDSSLPLRRPLSIMRVDAEAGWVEYLFKTHGIGLTALAGKPVGTVLDVMGPIGKPFTPDPERPLALLVGGGVGIPPMIYLAEALAADRSADWQPLVLMGSEIPFPLETAPSQHEVAGIPNDATQGLDLVEGWGIPTRLASMAGIEGAHAGYVTDLATHWLKSLSDADRDRVALYACGPTPMLAATARVAEQFDVPCQVSLEEYMACAVGGCAGCTVRVATPEGPAMKRVCVDGPVFDSRAVFGNAD
ncbi:MAG: dihydroorotate dehydrogenase electron transfer subunit [Pseudomonadota bacterium]